MLRDEADENLVWQSLSYYQVFWWQTAWLIWAANIMLDRAAGRFHKWFYLLASGSLLPNLINFVFGGLLLWKKNDDDKHFNSYFYSFLVSNMNGLLVSYVLIPGIQRQFFDAQMGAKFGPE